MPTLGLGDRRTPVHAGAIVFFLFFFDVGLCPLRSRPDTQADRLARQASSTYSRRPQSSKSTEGNTAKPAALRPQNEGPHSAVANLEGTVTEFQQLGLATNPFRTFRKHSWPQRKVPAKHLYPQRRWRWQRRNWHSCHCTLRMPSWVEPKHNDQRRI